MASLVADYGDSSGVESSSEESEIETSVEQVNVEPAVTTEKLPLPKFDVEGSIPLKNSVFTNPFVEAENAKSAILEKHVKMIPSKNDITHINGKQICWMYRKGRCRFGHNCKFAHDSDLYNGSSIESSEQPETNVICDTLPNSVDTTSDETFDNGETVLKKNKKRPGLSQNIVPGKKVLKMYKKQKISKSNTKS